jgi:hypothetical protein
LEWHHYCEFWYLSSKSIKHAEHKYSLRQGNVGKYKSAALKIEEGCRIGWD